jgi:F-type H+-transporting ATPase subunit epsilon
MNIVVSTHQGQLISDEVDYVVCKADDGEFAIMKNHIPTVAVIKDGYLKLVLNKQNIFVAVNNGVLEFSNNKVNVIAQIAAVGRDLDSVKSNLEKLIKDVLESNRQNSVDFAEKERDLMKNIRDSKAGNL